MLRGLGLYSTSVERRVFPSVNSGFDHQLDAPARVSYNINIADLVPLDGHMEAHLVKGLVGSFLFASLSLTGKKKYSILHNVINTLYEVLLYRIPQTEDIPCPLSLSLRPDGILEYYSFHRSHLLRTSYRSLIPCIWAMHGRRYVN